ncbi:MAG TPA: fused MFS/spermidine synthase [Candidatus Limnocylindrales bacterium]
MPIFALTIGWSAFLLFWVEPLVGQLVLPAFGGAPAVWAAVLVFFQAVLLLGYLYGHASISWLGPRRGAVVHVGLALAALAWLLVASLRTGDIAPTGLPAALDVLRILALTVGPPVFILTTTTPLVSAWFARRRGGTGGDPYWLYALSNGGSLLALLAYPFLIGPRFGLADQRSGWAVGFAALCLALVAAATISVLARPSMAGDAATDDDAASSATSADRAAAAVADEAASGPAIGWARRGRWILLAAVPSGLLAAVTTFIATDLISAPLLWVGPLALYLASFIVAFSVRGRRFVPSAVTLAPAAITLLWVPFGSAGGWPLLALIGLAWGSFAIVAIALHGRLAGDRPGAGHLTEFYLVQSVGGVLGGAFVALVAPLVFPGVWEYPILLTGALVALAATGSVAGSVGGAIAGPVGGATGVRRRSFVLSPFIAGAPGRLIPYLAVAAAIVGAMVLEHSIALPIALRWIGVGAVILLVGGPPRFLAAATGLTLAVAVLVIPNITPSPTLLQARSFFGVTAVIQGSPGDPWRVLMHGTTVHGSQSTDPALRRTPTGYYARPGPAGDAFAVLDETRVGAHIGLVGLGSGTLAAYEQPGQSMTYFEIDPLVIQVAEDPRYFTYLSDAPSPPTVVLGDGRFSLRQVPDATYDMLVLDAFSSDAIPTHLLTLEALTDDRRVIRPDGFIVIHVSNRYYDLAPATGAAGQRLGMTVLQRRYAPTAVDATAGASPSAWVVMTTDKATIAALRLRGWEDVDPTGVDPVTDDRPDVLRFLHIGG